MSPPTPLQLLSLPPELLARIIALLPAPSLPAVSLACRTLNTLATAPGEVYRLELERGGMVDGWGTVDVEACRLPWPGQGGKGEVQVKGWKMPAEGASDEAFNMAAMEEEDVSPEGEDANAVDMSSVASTRLKIGKYLTTVEERHWSINACGRLSPDGRADAWRDELDTISARMRREATMGREGALDWKLYDILREELVPGRSRSEGPAAWDVQHEYAVKMQKERRERHGPTHGVERGQISPETEPAESGEGASKQDEALRAVLTPAQKLDLLTKRRKAWDSLAPRPAIGYGEKSPSNAQNGDASGEETGAEATARATIAPAALRGRTDIPTEPADATSPAFRFSIAGETSIYECQDGIFLYTDNYMSAGQRRSPRNIRLYPLPTADEAFAKHNVPTASRYAGLAGGIADLTLDPLQDLLVAAENDPSPGPHGRSMHRYHFLTLSTLEPHPLAFRPTFDAPMWHNLTDITAQLIQVLGDIVGVLVTAYGPDGRIREKLMIWNWKTGEPLAHRSMRDYDQATGFVLLSPTHFLLVVSRDDGERTAPVVELMRIVSSRVPTVPEEAIWDFQERGPYALFDADLDKFPFTPRPIVLVTFELPAFAANTQTATVGIRPDPPSPPIHQSTPFAPHKPFLEDYRKGILVFEIRAVAVDPEANGVAVETYKGTLFAPRSFFVEAALQAEAQVTPSLRELIRVPWTTWGPLNTRLVPDQSSTSRQWVVNSSGWRFVTTTRGTPRTVQNAFIVPPRLGPHRVQVLDFAPLSVRRFRNEHPDEVAAIAEYRRGVTTESGATLRLRDEPSVVTKSKIFEAPVQTHLPYLELTSGQEYPCDGVMMDEQRVMLTRAHINAAGSLEQEVTVLTF